MPEITAEQKFACPACGGESVWNAARQKMVCPFCGTEAPVRLDAAGSLIEHDLIDEMTLLVVPVVLGQGRRLFADSGLDVALDLVDARVDSNGVTIQVFRPTGRPHYAPAAS